MCHTKFCVICSEFSFEGEFYASGQKRFPRVSPPDSVYWWGHSMTFIVLGLVMLFREDHLMKLPPFLFVSNLVVLNIHNHFIPTSLLMLLSSGM